MAHATVIKGIFASLLLSLLFACGRNAQQITFIPPPDAPVCIKLPHPEMDTDTIPPSNDERIYTVVAYMPRFVGGAEAMRQFIRQNLRYPPKLGRLDIEGRVYLRFVVGKDGKIRDIEVVRGLRDCPECDAEAVRLIRSMPKWKAGADGKERLNVYFTLPIAFSTF